MNPFTLYFTLSVIILTALLFFPISKLIWVLSVRRLEKKTQQTLSDAEKWQQLKRARVIALLIAFIFSLFFNIHSLRAG